MQQKKAYKYRFHPIDEQKQILAQTFGCCRYAYNWALRLRTDAYYNGQERINYHKTSAMLTELKKQKEMVWLNEVSCVPVQQALRHLDGAFRNFFEKRTGYPSFKRKGNAQAAEYTTSAFRFNGNNLTLAKMKEPLNIVWSRPLPEGCKPSTVTVTKDCADRYFISFLIEQDIQALPVNDNQIGIDLGLKSMVVTSDGHSYGNPKFFAKDEKKLAKAQRRHNKKKKGSRNRTKARLKVARIHARINDRRKDYQHKLSTKIIRENQFVCIESLSVKNMVKNRCLAKAISDVGWSEFTRQLTYKAQWYGRTLVNIDKWYPSSKRCHCCGYILDSLPLSVRNWTCPECGVNHDRDGNAAKNILAAGLAVHNACGETVRPSAAKAKQGKAQRIRKAA